MVLAAPGLALLLELLGAGVQLLVREIGRRANPGLTAPGQDLVKGLHVRIGRIGAVAPVQSVAVIVAVIVAVDRLDSFLRPIADLGRRDPVAAVAVERGMKPRPLSMTFENRHRQAEVEGATGRQMHRRVGREKRPCGQRQPRRRQARFQQALAHASLSGKLHVPLPEIGAHEPLEAFDAGIGQHHRMGHIGQLERPIGRVARSQPSPHVAPEGKRRSPGFLGHPFPVAVLGEAGGKGRGQSGRDLAGLRRPARQTACGP